MKYPFTDIDEPNIHLCINTNRIKIQRVTAKVTFKTKIYSYK